MKTSEFETQFAHAHRFDTKSLLTLVLFLLGSLLALPVQAQPTSPFMDCDGSARPITFGSVSDFNFVALDSYTGMNSDIEGLLAVGGNMTVQNYSVASSISSSFDGNSLVVDGDLSWSNGQVFSGDAVYTGTLTGGPNTPNGTLSHEASSPISFSGVEVALNAMSNSLAGRPTTTGASVNISGNNLTFSYTGTGSETGVVFNISASDFSSKNINFNISNTASNPSVLVNITGGDVTWQNAGVSLSGVSREYLLFNFNGVANLTASGIGLQGSILAPDAAFSFNNGQANGQIFVKSMNGNGETHNTPYCGDTETLLPVELTSFTATADGADVLLRWTTASETNNAGFSVELKQATATDFTSLEFVEGHGTTEAAQAYSYRFANLEPGTHTFRLKQIDYDGAFEYSPEVEVVIGLESAFTIDAPYPNPANPTAHFSFVVSREQAVSVDLYDVRGRMVQHVYQGTPAAGQVQDLTINGSSLPSGLYLVRVTGQSFMESRSLTLIK